MKRRHQRQPKQVLSDSLRVTSLHPATRYLTMYRFVAAIHPDNVERMATALAKGSKIPAQEWRTAIRRKRLWVDNRRVAVRESAGTRTPRDSEARDKIVAIVAEKIRQLH